MKKLALINSFCNNDIKIQTLKENLIKLKELNIDTLVYSPVSLPKEILELADFTFITKENPIIQWPERGIIHWKTINNIKLLLIVPDYGWASLYQFKKLSELAVTYNYDYYFWFLYDTQIDNVVIETLQIPNEKLFFNSSKTGTEVKCGNVFASFNKSNLIEFANLLDREEYIKLSNGKINEYYTELMANKIDANFSSHIIHDTLDEHSSLSFNLAPSNLPFKVFFNNEDELIFYIYEINDSLDDFKLFINKNLIDHDFLNGPLKTNINCLDIEDLSFTYKNKIYPLFQHLLSNTIQKLEIL